MEDQFGQIYAILQIKWCARVDLQSGKTPIMKPGLLIPIVASTAVLDVQETSSYD